MTFSADVRGELCAIESTACCRKAECYGTLLFGRSFSLGGISLQTESGTVAQRAASLLALETGTFAELRAPLTQRGHGRVYTVTVDDGVKPSVLAHFGHTGRESSLKINLANLENDCCTAAFLRGAFLACGTVSDPLKGYHLEFSVPRVNLLHSLEDLLCQLPFGLHPGFSHRGTVPMVYFKNSEEIADLLTYLGAMNSAMKLMQAKMLKEVRADANRRTNFDTANIDKTVNAATQQIDAIRRLQESGAISTLPEELRELAAIRVENPELSLRELGGLLHPPLTRSGVNHRLTKLIRLAEEI
ncbi:MAG: DNA-binding protein WhiA [Acutalibacteraceae bacterium]|jgi:DNA-binding protein WhiA